MSSLLGVHSLDHFVLAVPDLEEAERFYTAFGLELKPHTRSLALHTAGSTHCFGRVIEGAAKRLFRLSFGLFEEDLERFKRHLSLRRISFEPAPYNESGLWLKDPDGVLIELRVAEKSSPHTKSRATSISSPEGVPGAPKRSAAPTVRPTRLSHVLTFTRSVPKAIAFYTDVLGLRLSDRCGDDIAFLHGIHGSDHHLIAFARSEASGLHHSAWDVASVNDIGLGGAQMAAQGYREGWGVGRHVLGSNYFHYVRDPWGSHCEYSCDMDYIPRGYPWEARDHAPEDAFYIWGPEPPKDWTVNHEAERPT